MPAVLILHDVDDVDHWLKSPKRQKFMGPRRFTVRTFVDPANCSRVGLIIKGGTCTRVPQLMGT